MYLAHRVRKYLWDNVESARARSRENARGVSRVYRVVCRVPRRQTTHERRHEHTRDGVGDGRETLRDVHPYVIMIYESR